MSDPDRTLDAVQALYASGLVVHGPSARAVGWRDEASQALRFEKLAHLFAVADVPDGYSALDWGCGYGAMFDWLADRPRLPRLGRYVGCDIAEPMIHSARERVNDPRAEFVHGSRVDDEFDVAFVSGTFNVRFDAGDAEWESFVERTLVNLSARTRVGLAFNLMSSYVDYREPQLYYAEPERFFAFCKRRIGPRVTLLHDYPLWEWTMVALKG